MTLTVIILAAGKGTRMKSNKPKVLQPLAGKPMLAHVLNAANALNPTQIICVVGHEALQITEYFSNQSITWVTQQQQLGTGHAVLSTLDVLPKNGTSLILYGDVPCITPQTLTHLLAGAKRSGIALISLELDQPFGYGRIVREAGEITQIVEQKDLQPHQADIREINTGLYAVDNSKLHQWLPKLTNHNAQKEYYLTDIVAMAAQEQLVIESIAPQVAKFEVDGVNDRMQLAALERALQTFKARELMTLGLTLLDPNRFDLRGTLAIGEDVVIDSNVIIEGDCSFGNNVHIGSGCILRNVTIGAGSVIAPYSLIDTATIGCDTHIGPYARIRPGTRLGDQTHVGNFVEIKNSSLGKGSKANHLSYVGDAIIGAQCNIGAGTITCNYDGANKHQTQLGDHVFIGSNSALVAPIVIADGATIGAGSVITKPVDANQLAIARSMQRNIANYTRPKKTTKP